MKSRLARTFALCIPDRFAVEQDFSLGRLEQTVQMLNKRGLARTGVTDHAEDLSLVDLNIDMVERDTLKRGACAVNMRQAPCFKYG